ncbi:diacylglycerol/lipid kinase family protein [Georgenia sp.]
MGWDQWVAIVALVLALAGLLIGLVAWRGIRGRTPSFSEEDTPETLPPAPRSGPPAVIVNPKSADGIELKELMDRTAADAGLEEPIWFETTVEDPGLGQTRAALARGASVVVAAGGDGTVRAVAEALAGTGVPMGLLPLGTGNLLARNLDLPLGSRRELVLTALTGRDRRMDLGWLRTEALTPEDAAALRGNLDDGAAEVPDDDPTKEHVFLVIGGLGFDAAMVAGADDDLKARLGWIAYFVAGVRHLTGRKIHATAELGESGPGRPFKARTVLFANVGRLPGGVVLFPDAQLDDGWLDIAAIDTTGGLIGWADLLRKVILQGMGVRKDPLPYRTASIEFKRARSVVVRTEVPEQVQVDGDLIGYARVIHARVEESGLVVRTR